MTHRTLPLVGLALLAASPLLPAQQRGVVTFGEALDDLTVGGSLRMRVENRNATPPVVGAPADTLGTLRARVFLDAAFSERLGAKVEFQHVVADQGQPSDEFLRQAWLAWSDVVPGGDLQVGRMQLDYGHGRMISSYDWDMVGRAWDGILWSQDFGGVQGDLFWT
ncbi:MAG: alginate export family protein, partial [Planctomycetota bacterium]